jgi:hypothetical protein
LFSQPGLLHCGTRLVPVEYRDCQAEKSSVSAIMDPDRRRVDTVLKRDAQLRQQIASSALRIRLKAPLLRIEQTEFRAFEIWRRLGAIPLRGGKSAMAFLHFAAVRPAVEE